MRMVDSAGVVAVVDDGVVVDGAVVGVVEVAEWFPAADDKVERDSRNRREIWIWERKENRIGLFLLQLQTTFTRVRPSARLCDYPSLIMPREGFRFLNTFLQKRNKNNYTH